MNFTNVFIDFNSQKYFQVQVYLQHAVCCILFVKYHFYLSRQRLIHCIVVCCNLIRRLC